MASVVQTILSVNDAVLKPLRTRVDFETVALMLVIALAVAAAWHMVLESVDVASEEIEGET